MRLHANDARAIPSWTMETGSLARRRYCRWHVRLYTLLGLSEIKAQGLRCRVVTPNTVTSTNLPDNYCTFYYKNIQSLRTTCSCWFWNKTCLELWWNCNRPFENITTIFRQISTHSQGTRCQLKLSTVKILTTRFIIFMWQRDLTLLEVRGVNLLDSHFTTAYNYNLLTFKAYLS